METPQQTSFLPPAGKPSVKCFGVGNAGAALLELLRTPEFAGVATIAVNTDAAALASSGADIKFHLENKLLRGLGSAGDSERAHTLAEEHFSSLKAACEGANVVFILAGLGGGAGSGISPVLARAAHEAGALVIAFVLMPFACEGNRREVQAQQAMELLKANADGAICLPGDKIFRLIDENSSLIDTFHATGSLLLEGVRGVWQLLMRPGIIQVHFSDLCGLIRDRHAENAFAFVEAAGPGRAREVVEKLLQHPLLDEGRVLAESEAVLVSLTAGKDLTMKEVERVTSGVKQHCVHAQIIVGAAVDPALEDRLCVTVIAARHGLQSTPENVKHTAVRVGVAPAAVATNASRETPQFVGTGSRPAARRVKKMVQSQLPLSIVTRGYFDKSEPNLHNGQDLDIPTFIRRGIVMN